MKVQYPISPNYVKSWGVKEAIRELIQNAMDSDKDFTITQEDGTICIQNHGAFSLNALLLGNSEKADGAIGCHGEGMKLAMLILAREGIAHCIYSGGYQFFGSIGTHEQLGEVFCINYDTAMYCDGDKANYEAPTDTIVYIDTDVSYQSVYIPGAEPGIRYTNEKALYIAGLKVCELPDFSYSYNMPHGTVKLDRDRSAVDSITIEKFAANQLLAKGDYDHIAFLLHEGKADVDLIPHVASIEQNRKVAEAVAKHAKANKLPTVMTFSNSSYHYRNYAIQAGYAQRAVSKTAQAIYDLIESDRRYMRAGTIRKLKEIAKSA